MTRRVYAATPGWMTLLARTGISTKKAAKSVRGLAAHRVRPARIAARRTIAGIGDAALRPPYDPL